MVFRVLDLFSGTKSIEKTLSKLIPDVEVVSVDFLEKFKPTIVADLLTFDYKSEWKPKQFDAVWCSTPCTAYSKARNSVPREFGPTDELVKRAIQIIEYLDPNLWFMENPRAHMRRRPFMKKMNKYLHTVNYCRYSGRGDVYKYPKATDIWTNKLNFVPLTCTSEKRCKYFRGGSHPITAQKGISFSAVPARGSIKPENVYKVPKKLIAELFSDHIPGDGSSSARS